MSPNARDRSESWLEIYDAETEATLLQTEYIAHGTKLLIDDGEIVTEGDVLAERNAI